MIISTHNLPSKFYIYVTEKKYSSTDNLLRAFGTHSDPFISDDVCCYSQPRFDETAKLFHKYAICTMASFYYYDQNSFRFSFHI